MHYHKLTTVIELLALGLAALLQGCALPTRLPAVPQNLVSAAEVPGMPGIRTIAVGEMTQFTLDWQQSIEAELAFRAKTGQQVPLPSAFFLAISGGGDDGAYLTALDCSADGLPPAPGPSSNW
jgi:hypothetical protein